MSLKDIEFWMSLYDILKDVWFLILIPIVISIVKLLNKNDLYQTRNVEKIKMVLKKYAVIYFDYYWSTDIFGVDDIFFIECLS
ncbi:hypothetical protein ACVXZ0_18300 [Staphylococcus aureus]